MEQSANEKQVLRAKKKLLRVTFPNEEPICYSSTTLTFMDTLRRIGIEKLQTISLELGHLPLICQERHPKFEKYMKPLVHGWYVNILSDSEQKYRQLYSINRKLNLGMKIELSDEFVPSRAKGFTKESRAARENLLVKFPDGEFVASDSQQSTFIESIKKIGIDKLKGKDIFSGKKELVTPTEKYHGQVQIDNSHWLTIPPTTKDKYKMLKVVAVMTGVNIEITLI